jgi:DNA ligase-1
MTELKTFIDEMRSTSSATEKSVIIARSSTFIHDVLEATYNPYKQYHITSKTCLKNSELIGYKSPDTLLSLLKMLNTREVTGHDAIKLVNRFAQSNTDWELIYKIIDKDLDIRIGAKGINKGVPGLIPTFSVVLAKEYEEGKCVWGDGWYASRKLDGVRCLARVDTEGKCTLFSRTGKEFTTLNKVKESIEATGIVNVTFDGEICLVDGDGNEDFQGVMKQLRRKNHQIKNPAYMIFDMLDNKDFDNVKGEVELEKRLDILRSWVSSKFTDNNILRYAEQYRITGDEHLQEWIKMASDNKWEGVMLRKNVGYEGKRTKNLVKVKKFFDAEYKVVDFDIDNHEVVRDGKSVTMQMLAQVYIEHKGHKVKVGSGFTQEQRLQYMDGSIVGKLITVQYFEETHNDKGGISLRFPTVKHIYSGSRDM